MPLVTMPDHEHKELLSFKERFLALVGKEGEAKAPGEDKGITELQAQVDKLQDAIDDQTAETAKVQKAYDEAVEENGTLTAKVKELEAAAEKAAG